MVLSENELFTYRIEMQVLPTHLLPIIQTLTTLKPITSFKTIIHTRTSTLAQHNFNATSHVTSAGKSRRAT